MDPSSHTRAATDRDAPRDGAGPLTVLDGGPSTRDRGRDPNWIRECGAVIDRLERLRVVLPAMAQETARLRREAARLRSEKSDLSRRLGEIEASIEAGRRLMREPRARSAPRKESA
jgi:hypothetical protein